MTIPPFAPDHLESIAEALGDTDQGLTGSVIGRLLSDLGYTDPGPITKRDRIREALSARQGRDRAGNCVIAFIERALSPARFRTSPDHFESLREQVNVALAFAGMQVGEDGKVKKVTAARTLSEAQARAGRLKAELMRRHVHHDVLRFCREELLHENYFHAVFEATKSVADKIRQLSGLQTDGTPLVDQAFGTSQGLPVLAFNSLRTETERSEHTGLMNLLKGMFGTFRNTTGHAPKITWKIEESDALDLLTLVSLLHRRLDAAVKTRP